MNIHSSKFMNTCNPSPQKMKDVLKVWCENVEDEWIQTGRLPTHRALADFKKQMINIWEQGKPVVSVDIDLTVVVEKDESNVGDEDEQFVTDAEVKEALSSKSVEAISETDQGYKKYYHVG